MNEELYIKAYANALYELELNYEVYPIMCDNKYTLKKMKDEIIHHRNVLGLLLRPQIIQPQRHPPQRYPHMQMQMQPPQRYQQMQMQMQQTYHQQYPQLTAYKYSSKY